MFASMFQQAALRQPFKVRVKKSGRMRGPDLSDPQLKTIGDQMLKAQFHRWDDGLNTSDHTAKKLSFKYFKEKQKYTGQNSPIRDMKMTGELIKNFSLRRASRGQIRAENTSRVNRDKATRAQKYEDMIGFAGSDQIVIFRESQAAYGRWLQKAWVPIG